MARNCIGLDIGSHSIKVVQVKESKGRVSLVSFGMQPLPAQSIVDGAIMNQGVIVEAITSLWSRLKLRDKKVAIAIAGHSVIIKKITVPQMTQAELHEQIKWEAEHHIPFDPQDVQIDYQVLDRANMDGQMDLLLVAAKNEVVNDYTAVVQDASLSPVVVDLAAFAVQNAFEISYGFPPEETVVLVNVGASISTINIVRNGATTFTRDVTIGGNAYTEELQKQLQIGFEEAEAYKLGASNAAAGEVVPDEVERVMDHVSNLIAGEFQRSIDFFLATTSGADINRIYLSGGTAQVAALQRSVERRSHLAVEIIDPFANVVVDETKYDVQHLRAHAPVAAVAFGLALRRPRDSAR